MNYNYNNNRPSWKARFKMSKEDIKKRRFFSIFLHFFYILCFVFIVISVLYWWGNKQTFYLVTNEVSMIMDDDYQIQLYGKTETKENDEYVYTSDNPLIATVDSNGIIHSVSEGETFVTVKSKYSTKKNIIKVHVEGDEIYSVEFENNDIELDINEKVNIKPIVNNNKDFKADFIWRSENSRVAYVDSKGEIIGTTPGTTYINVKVRGTNISTKLKVRVSDKDYEEEEYIADNSLLDNAVSGYDIEENNYIGVVGVNINVSKNSLRVGETLKVNYAISPNNATNKGVTWYSSDSSVVSVDNSGNIKALKVGSADISIKTKDGNKTSFVTINVINDSKALKINKSNTTLTLWRSELLSVSYDNSDTSLTDVVWTSSNPNIVAVAPNGKITGWMVGNATITATTKDGAKASCFVEVKNISTKITSVKLSHTDLNMARGGKQQLKVSIEPSDAANQNISWTSSNSKVVKVDSYGNISAVGLGDATITAMSTNGKTATCHIKVNDVKINKITLNRSVIQIYKGSNYKIKASISPSNAANKSLSYKSGNNGIALVDSNGVITGKGLGSTTIKVSAKDGSGKVANIKVVVVPKVNLINISKKTYRGYRNNIATYMGTNYSKHMQNFAIVNQGKSNETIYFSGVTTGSIASKKINSTQRANLNRSYVVQVPTSQIRINTKNRKTMWLENTGHGQSFDMESNGTIWINAGGIPPYYSGGSWFGKHSSIMRIKFAPNVRKGKFKYLTKLTAKDTAGKSYSAPDVSVDDINDLLALRSGKKVLVYKLSEAKKGKLKLLYTFNVADSYGTYRQGNDIYGGYYYMYTGKPGGVMNITAYNMLGEKQFSKNFYIKNANQAKKNNEEAEGLKIYNNKIFIGHTHKDGKGGALFDIGYFK